MWQSLKDQLQRVPAIGITGVYILFGLLWIFFSDQFLQSAFPPALQASLQTLKGFLYVFITGLLLFGLATYFTRELRAQNQRYRVLFQDNPLPMWICDPQSLQVLDTNQAACDHYGYSFKQFKQLQLGELEPVSPPLILQQMASPSPLQTLTHLNQQGQPIEVWLSFRQLPQGLLVIAHDISEQKKLERQQLKLNQTLVHQNQDLQQFANIVAHHLRGPVANLEGLTAIFNYAEPADPLNLQVLEKLQGSAEKLDHILSDLGAVLSQRDTASETWEEVALRPLISGVLKELAYLLPQPDWQPQLELEMNYIPLS